MSEKHLYEYAVIRYVPRVEREEFVNIGLIMMCKRRRWLKVALNFDIRRIEAMRPSHTLEQIECQCSTFTALADGNPAAGQLAGQPVEERFRWLTAVKSACIQTSRPHPGLTGDLDATFKRLLEELVL